MVPRHLLQDPGLGTARHDQGLRPLPRGLLRRPRPAQAAPGAPTVARARAIRSLPAGHHGQPSATASCEASANWPPSSPRPNCARWAATTSATAAGIIRREPLSSGRSPVSTPQHSGACSSAGTSSVPDMRPATTRSPSTERLTGAAPRMCATSRRPSWSAPRASPPVACWTPSRK